MTYIFIESAPRLLWVNSLWPRDTIWRHKSESTLAQAMACCLTHQAITWTYVDLSSVRSSGIHLRAILQEVPQPSVTEISLKITYRKFCSNLPEANELIQWYWKRSHWWYCSDTMPNFHSLIKDSNVDKLRVSHMYNTYQVPLFLFPQ